VPVVDGSDALELVVAAGAAAGTVDVEEADVVFGVSEVFAATGACFVDFAPAERVEWPRPMMPSTRPITILCSIGDLSMVV
jgi:hypothetical protein